MILQKYLRWIAKKQTLLTFITCSTTSWRACNKTMAGNK